jgi:hypothetical protein
MSFKQLIEEYINDLRKEIKTAQKSGEFTPELSFRPPP